MSLRARLVAGLLVVVTAGLIAANVATYSALRSFLTQRVDQQLDAARFPVAGALARGGGPFGPRPDGRHEIPPGTYGEVRDGSGTVLEHVVFGFDEASVSTPRLPRTLPGSGGSSTAPSRFNTGSTSGSSTRFRVLAVPLADSGSLIIAVPLHDVAQTLGRLRRVELIVSLAVLVGLGALAWWVVRLGLRPLSSMEQTAEAIAAGNLSERVDAPDPRTEVGRLGQALNTMLTRIEEAFAQRRASEERLRRFVADASHELRTPLTSIRGYAELFRRGADRRPEDLAKAMRRIEEEASRLGVLVEDLLRLARLDEGRPLEQAPVDLARLATDGVDDVRAVDPKRPLDLDRPDEPVEVVGDEARLRQVVANLLTNARSHTPKGTPIHVAVGTDDGHAYLDVADEGPGLPPGDEERIFDRFYRADPSRSRTRGGTGLGLAIVAAVTEAHGGRVSVRNDPGHGVAFRVQLPLAADVHGANGAP